MKEHSCDLCHAPAVIHDTQAQGDVVKVRHLCRAHGIAIWNAALPCSESTAQTLLKDPVFQSLAAQVGKTLHRRGGKDPEL